MKFLSTFPLRFVHRGIELAALYLRTKHNVSADEIARLGEKDMPEWGNRKGLERKELPDIWADFRPLPPHLDWGRSRYQISPRALPKKSLNSSKGRAVGVECVVFHRNRTSGGSGVSEFTRCDIVAQRRSRVWQSGWNGRLLLVMRPIIFLGTSHTGHEILTFQKHLGKMKTPIAPLVTPSGITGSFLPAICGRLIF